jgi:indole-3-acetate monooxygenase
MSVKPDIPELMNFCPMSPDTAEWLARVDEMGPVIVGNKDRGERERASPDVVFRVLQDAGVPRMWVSREFGGSQVSLETGSAVIQALARLDASVAWQMGVQGAIGRLADYLPEPTARKLFLDHEGLVVGSVNPTGLAEVTSDGFVLSGTWPFASGYAHADWLVCAAVVNESGRPRTGADGKPETRMLFVPKDECTVLDTWHTIGLRGTGSNHYRVSGALVSEDFTVPGSALLNPPPCRPSRGYAIGYYDFGPFTSASTVLGIARGAVDAARELARSKTPAAATSTLAGSHTVQEKVADAEALVRSARLILADAAWHATKYGETGGDALSAVVRLAAATVARSGVSAVDTAFQIAGTSAIYASSPLERYFRDVHTAAKHITLSHSHFEMVGQYLLGGELQMRR